MARAESAGTGARTATKRKPVRRRVVPAQRRDGIEALGLRVADLVVADHDARDAQLWDALEWAPGEG